MCLSLTLSGGATVTEEHPQGGRLGRAACQRPGGLPSGGKLGVKASRMVGCARERGPAVRPRCPADLQGVGVDMPQGNCCLQFATIHHSTIAKQVGSQHHVRAIPLWGCGAIPLWLFPCSQSTIGMHLLHFDGRSTTLTFLVKDKWNLHGQTLEARAQPWGLERSQTSTPRPSATGCLSAGPMHGGTPVRNPAHSRNTSALDPRLLSGLHHSTSAKASRAWASSKAREGEWGRANSFVRNFPPGRRICSGGW